MDVTGNVGLHVKNSDILWDAGEVDADTILIAEGVTGTVQSLTDQPVLELNQHPLHQPQ